MINNESSSGMFLLLLMFSKKSKFIEYGLKCTRATDMILCTNDESTNRAKFEMVSFVRIHVQIYALLYYDYYVSCWLRTWWYY